MLKHRILSTLRFFDLQDIPLTLLELHRFLIGNLDQILLSQDEKWELFSDLPLEQSRFPQTRIDEILSCLENECRDEVENTLGFYHLPGRSGIASLRWSNYFFGAKRERKIRRFLPLLKHLPFIRGVAIGGSQSLGQQREGSDIDLLIITEPKFLWLARIFVSAYFQIFGQRRHGTKIANRFCLNHYVAGPKAIKRERNLYKAMEYVRLRPLIYPRECLSFMQNNQDWIRIYLPNFYSPPQFPEAVHFKGNEEPQSKIQKILEAIFKNPLGMVLEYVLGFIQKLKIRQDEFIFVLPDELSFHPHSQHRILLSKFFQHLSSTFQNTPSA